MKQLVFGRRFPLSALWLFGLLWQSASAHPLTISVWTRTGDQLNPVHSQLQIETDWETVSSAQLSIKGARPSKVRIPQELLSLLLRFGRPSDYGARVEVALRHLDNVLGPIRSRDPNLLTNVVWLGYLQNILLDIETRSDERGTTYVVGAASAYVSSTRTTPPLLLPLSAIRNARPDIGLLPVVIRNDALEAVHMLRRDPDFMHPENLSARAWLVSAHQLRSALSTSRGPGPIVSVLEANPEQVFYVSPRRHEMLIQQKEKSRWFSAQALQLSAQAERIRIPFSFRPWHKVLAATRTHWALAQLANTLDWKRGFEDSFPTELAYDTRPLFAGSDFHPEIQETHRDTQRAPNSSVVRFLLDRALPQTQSPAEFLYLVLPEQYDRTIPVRAQQAARHLEHFFSLAPRPNDLVDLSRHLPLSPKSLDKIFKTFESDLDSPEELIRFFSVGFRESTDVSHHIARDRLAGKSFAASFQRYVWTTEQVIRFAKQCFFQKEWRFYTYGYLFDLLAKPSEFLALKGLEIRNPEHWDEVIRGASPGASSLAARRACIEPFAQCLLAYTRDVGLRAEWISYWLQLGEIAGGPDMELLKLAEGLTTLVSGSHWYLLAAVQGLRKNPAVQKMFVENHIGHFFSFPPSLESLMSPEDAEEAESAKTEFRAQLLKAILDEDQRQRVAAEALRVHLGGGRSDSAPPCPSELRRLDGGFSAN